MMIRITLRGVFKYLHGSSMTPAKRGDKITTAKEPFDTLMNINHTDIGIVKIVENRSQPGDRSAIADARIATEAHSPR